MKILDPNEISKKALTIQEYLSSNLDNYNMFVNFHGNVYGNETG